MSIKSCWKAALSPGVISLSTVAVRKGAAEEDPEEDAMEEESSRDPRAAVPRFIPANTGTGLRRREK